MAARLSTAALVLAWCLLAVGDATHAGYFTPVGLGLVALGLVTLGVVLAAGMRLAPVEPLWMLAPLGISFVYVLANPTRVYLYLHGTRLYAIQGLAAATAASAVALVVLDKRWRTAAWWLVVALATATGLVTILLIVDPHIDVFELLQQSSTGLLHGKNMYQQHWTDSTGLQNVYPYLPWTTVLLAPFRWLFTDVRVGLLFAIVVSAFVVRQFGRRNGEDDGRAELISCLLLVAPGWVLLVNRSWTEPLLVMLIGIAIFAIRAGKGWLAVLAFALALASKQHIIFLIPLFALWPAFGIRRTITSIGLAVVGVLPWVIASPHAFWHDAVHANLSLGTSADALDLPAAFIRHGHRLGFGVALAFLVVAYVIALARVPRTPAGLALGGSLVMWAFDFANKATFFNHYQLPLGLLVIGLVLAGEDSSPSPSHENEAVSAAVKASFP